MIGTGLPAPTRAESLRMDLIVDGGCLACAAFAELFVPCEVHHLTVGGKHGAPRLGHSFTVGLCCWHHRGVPWPDWQAHRVENLVGPSYALTPSRFRAVYGGDRVLMALQRLKLREVADRYFPPRGVWADPPNDAPELA